MTGCQVCDTLTSVKKVNKTDAVTLLSTFGVSVTYGFMFSFCVVEVSSVESRLDQIILSSVRFEPQIKPTSFLFPSMPIIVICYYSNRKLILFKTFHVMGYKTATMPFSVVCCHLSSTCNITSAYQIGFVTFSCNKDRMHHKI